jgi:glycosyltransferase involved in cell wall biosynthesis
VLLLTRNEERRIERCLASVAWADEIVVVDGCSSDRTVELCRRAGATVIQRPFSGSFAEERNAGLRVATGEWVLQMDADEVVPPELRQAIERLLRDPNPPSRAYQVWRRNIFLGRVMRYGGWYHRHLCVFRREGHWYHGLVHERLNVHGPVGRLEVELQHEPFGSLEQFVARQNRYTSLQARERLAARGRLPWRAIRRTVWLRPLKRWWKFYVKKQGAREGMHGLVFSVLFAWVEFLVWIKYAELACPDAEVPRSQGG